jgi:hypothetical protein
MDINDLTFCRRRVIEYARRAVYAYDRQARQSLTKRASAWAELAQAVESNALSVEDLRLKAELA